MLKKFLLGKSITGRPLCRPRGESWALPVAIREYLCAKDSENKIMEEFGLNMLEELKILSAWERISEKRVQRI